MIGEIPILASEQRLLDSLEESNPSSSETPISKPTSSTRVLADGTYATETIYSSVAAAKISQVHAANRPPLRALILAGDFYTGTVLAATLTKLVLRYKEESGDEEAGNGLRAEVRRANI